jgi:hypothetical protein
MPTIKVAFTEEELSAIRSEVDRAAISPEIFVHHSALAAAAGGPFGVASAAAEVAERSAQLNARLAPSGTGAESAVPDAEKARNRESS